MKFSVIVPVYKVEKYIRQCIESVLNQTYKDFELILVDDGSPDNCPRICDEYALKDERVVVIHKENGGLVSARKVGAKTAQGEYVACLDGDDYFMINFLEEFSKIIECFSPDIIVGGYNYAYDNGEVKDRLMMEREGYYDKKGIEENFMSYLIEDIKGKYFSPNIWGKVYKRNIYVNSQLKVDSRIKIGEDHCCTKVCIFNAESVYVSNERLYYYRQNDSSMTKNKSVFDINAPKLIAKHFEKNIDLSLFDFQEQVYRRTVHDLFNAAVSQFNGKDGYKAAKARVKTALKDEYYKIAIKKCKFKVFSKGWLAKQALKHKLYFLMKIYNGRG